ncbi:XrtA system polysaccharide chain length determinant [Dyella kyungheensis]|uniref:XrtA system polysaccharide chain length determinant n=1 Tax=Dyella kyungheensis TaxID=1242174 RepID=UPI003CED35F6
MSGELRPMASLVPALINEARRRRLMLGIAFALIALAALTAGMLWPRKYVASTTILAQESSIITPLMEGAAAPTANKNRANMARDVIFSRKVMAKILEAGGWMATNPSPVEQDRLAEAIKSRTQVQITRDNLITIAYSDNNAKRTFEVARAFAQLFISESLTSKQRESREAYEFINSQVEAYRAKLTDAEDKLKAYRDANADARPGSEADTAARISQLRTQIESARMDMMERRSMEGSLASQLNGESEVNTVQTANGVLQAQLGELQAQLNKLQLTYTDSYPDVVRIRHQIDDLKKQLAVADQRQQAGTPTALDSNVMFNPAYQQIKTQLATARAASASAAARMGASESMLQAELQRSARIANSENVTAELTRDYNVNRDVYQDLLKRRENARVSMNLDAEQRGLNFLVQNPAVMPLSPTGLRFLHFGLAGMGLSLALPLGLLLALVWFDPRVRSVWQLEQAIGTPVLASIPFYPTPGDRRRDRMRNTIVGLIVIGVGAVYLIAVWIRLKG